MRARGSSGERAFMSVYFNIHQETLSDALIALQKRTYWSPFSEIPSGKIYGENAKANAENEFQAFLGQRFEIDNHPQSCWCGDEVSPYGLKLDIQYPMATANELITASQIAAPILANSTIESRTGACLEILSRLNKLSFLIANATMHTTGQAFAMAFQAGGPHAQDRGLEAIAVAWAEMERFSTKATWDKPQGKSASIILEKEWLIRPAGLALTIGCNTFPTWNSYPGIFASLMTGNPVIIKPHPSAILPLALTVKIAREVFLEAGLPENSILLAVDTKGAEVTKSLASNHSIKIIDYTGSSQFGDWLRENARHAQLFTEETGVNSVIIAGTNNFSAMCTNLAFSISLYSGQMCTSPQNIYIPENGIPSDEGHKSFDDVAQGISLAIDELLSEQGRAANICGAIANPLTLERVSSARQVGTILRDTVPLGVVQSATPMLIVLDKNDTSAESEFFGPITFLIKASDAVSAIMTAADLALRKGAITAAIYDTNEADIDKSIQAFTQAGVNLSINLTGNIFVNQSAAFSDFHVTGANPAGNASLTDTAFVASRFRRVMSRRIPSANAA